MVQSGTGQSLRKQYEALPDAVLLLLCHTPLYRETPAVCLSYEPAPLRLLVQVSPNSPVPHLYLYVFAPVSSARLEIYDHSLTPLNIVFLVTCSVGFHLYS